MRTWYYARHGRQFGPVGIEQIKLLLGTGGLDHEDLVWREGMPAWVPASEVEELNPPVIVQPPPLPPEAQAGPMAPAEGGDIPPGSEPILVSMCLTHAWRRLKAQAPLLLTAGAIYVAISLGAAYLGQAIDEMRGYHPSAMAWSQGNAEMDQALSELMKAPSVPVIIAGVLIEFFLSLGFMRMALNVLRGEKTGLAQIFGEWRIFPKILLASVLYYTLVFAGLLLMIVPGILAAVVFGQFRYGILERNMGVMESFSFSMQVTRNSLAPLMLLGLVTSAAIVAGELTLQVGLIAAIPFTMMVQAAAYHWLTKGARDAFQKE